MKLTKYLCHVFTLKDVCWMMEFILWAIFTKIVSEVVIIKRLWLSKNIVIIEKDCDN